MQRAKKLYGAIVVLCSMVAVPAVADTSDKPQQQQQQQQEAKPIEVRAVEANIVANVEAVDTANRELTLKTDQGVQFKVKVPDDVPNLDTLSKGDTVGIRYLSTMALALDRVADKPKAAGSKTVTRVPGPLPGGATAERITATLEVEKVDKSNNRVTLRAPDGTIDTVQVTDPALRAELAHLKKGDKVRADYTEAIAIAIAPKTAKK